ncbi:MAG: nitrite/sulfite reductase [Candidatus Omnitrophica bacterium]|nr:nitrite/sulfite reductase [Candidatus Omnitrophota bacterium]
MPNRTEQLKATYGNPFDVLKAVERAAAQGYESLSEDDLFMCKWVGLYTHRNEQGYFMLRTKQPNGFVTPEQLETIADIAERQNRGYADITTRQDFQLHWVHYTEAVPIIRRLQSVGISTLGACGDVARNVVGCPVAGVDREEILDAGPVANEVSRYFLGNPAYANLPRKYKISVSGCTTWCCHPEIQCVALVGAQRRVSATTRGGSASGGNGESEAGFDLRVGGGLSTQPFISQRLNAFVRPGEAVEVIVPHPRLGAGQVPPSARGAARPKAG